MTNTRKTNTSVTIQLGNDAELDAGPVAGHLRLQWYHKGFTESTPLTYLSREQARELATRLTAICDDYDNHGPESTQTQRISEHTQARKEAEKQAAAQFDTAHGYSNGQWLRNPITCGPTGGANR